MQKKAVLFGLFAGLSFGIATPVSKLLLDSLSGYMLAGLLYFGAALVFLPYMVKNFRADFRPALLKNNGLKLLGIITFGGILGPLFLLAGLNNANSTSVSIWLNFELVATALLGVLFFKEHLSRYALLGVLFTILSGILISLNEDVTGLKAGIFVMIACIFWGLDNHLTATVDGISSQATTFIKGLVGGTVNVVLAVVFSNPSDLLQSQAALAVLLGMVSYGISIVLYVSASQIIGATRGQILFSASPLWGITGAAIFLAEPVNWTTLASFVLLSIGVVFSNVRGHTHAHSHMVIQHIHLHTHTDGHHFHEHGNPAKEASHIHIHSHGKLHHGHDHFPDLQHRHDH
ncbi:MAG: EamA family transporter [Anaerolineales bacterium]|nr:MAG: EamA family transporter [Anaerolineales bacterium]